MASSGGAVSLATVNDRSEPVVGRVGYFRNVYDYVAAPDKLKDYVRHLFAEFDPDLLSLLIGQLYNNSLSRGHKF